MQEKRKKKEVRCTEEWREEILFPELAKILDSKKKMSMKKKNSLEIKKKMTRKMKRNKSSDFKKYILQAEAITPTLIAVHECMK